MSTMNYYKVVAVVVVVAAEIDTVSRIAKLVTCPISIIIAVQRSVIVV